jgi:predicted dehydrogenase
MDLSIWVGGVPNPVSVSANMTRLFPGKRGGVIAKEVHARFDNGATYVFEGNWCDERKNSHGFELVTECGTMRSDPFAVKVDKDGQIVDQTPQLKQADGWGESIRDQDADLVDRLLSGTPWGMQEPHQLLNLQRLVDGCYASAAQGREVVF